MNPGDGPVAAIAIDVRVERGTALPGRIWCADRPRGLVAIVHGLGEHSGRYAALASRLVAARFTVVSLDLPGHGESPGPRGDMSWSLVRDQVIPAMFTASRGMPGQPGELPVVLIGHSMGGLLALDHALHHQRALSALVLSAPALRTPVPPWWKLALAQLARWAAPAAGFPNGLDPEGLARDPEVVRGYRDDPRVHDRISPRLYFDFLDAQRRCRRDVQRLQLPALVLQGMADRLVDPKGALDLFGAAPHGRMRFVTLKDTYHELFNDTGRDAVLRDMIAWLDAAVVV